MRAVVLPFLTMTPFEIARREGYFADRGLDVEFVQLPRIQELMTALSRGEVDVATGMLNVSVLNSIATGQRVRIVGALGYLTPDRCSFHGWIARRALVESGALAAPEDLRGQVVDANLLLPEAHWLDSWLRRGGLGIDDLELVDVPPAATEEAVRAGSVDLAALPQPLLSAAVDDDDLVLWHSSEEMAPGQVVSVMMFGPELLDGHPEVGERLAAAVLEAARRFQEGKTPANLAAAVEFTGLTPEQVSSACWPVTRLDARIDYASFHGYQEWAVGRGLLGRVLPEAEVIDHRFMDAANARLAPEAGAGTGTEEGS